MDVRDSNGTVLADGDNVTLIKGIRLTGNEDEIECRAEKIKDLVLRTEFLKKA
ncbi:PhnA protein [Agrobacterium rhizogenes]|nr:PhnA protein [Rhizobium rhizogenes]